MDRHAHLLAARKELRLAPALLFLTMGTCVLGQTARGQAQAVPAVEGKAVDLHDDALPPGALARLGTTRLRHVDDLAVVAFSPDGKYLASAGGDFSLEGQVGERSYRIRLWETATGRQVGHFGGHEIHIEYVVFSPDGRALAVGGREHTLCLWDVGSGRMLWSAQAAGITVPATDIAFSPDGTSLVSAYCGQIVHRWDRASGKLLGQFRSPKHGVSSVLWSPDGRFVAAAGQTGAVHVWDVASGKLLEQFERQRARLDLHFGGEVLALSRDGGFLATANCSGPIQVWETASGERVLRLEPPHDNIHALAFSPDGRELAAGGRGITPS
jgi:WD40 repeat protein